MHRIHRPTFSQSRNLRRKQSHSRLRAGIAPGQPGQAVLGAAFYVWDEDPAYAREWGAELARTGPRRRGRPRA